METTSERSTPKVACQSKNIRQLLEMLDNPEAYTEQEIHDIINRDEDTRETYRMMVEAKRSSRQRLAEKPVDVDAAWQKISEKLIVKSEKFATASPVVKPHSSFMKMAASLTFGRACSRSEEQMQASLSSRLVASFIGVLLVSGIAFAAIWSLTPSPSPKGEGSENTLVLDTAKKVTTPLSSGRGVGGEAYIYDNIPLEKMLPEIAAHYDAKVTFVNDEARQLRFRFVWNPQKGIDQVISDLNQFERLTVTLKDNQITVE